MAEHIKRSKKEKAPSLQSQQGNVNIEMTDTFGHTPINPLDAYNKFIRKEGEPVLDQEQFDKRFKVVNNKLVDADSK